MCVNFVVKNFLIIEVIVNIVQENAAIKVKANKDITYVNFAAKDFILEEIIAVFAPMNVKIVIKNLNI